MNLIKTGRWRKNEKNNQSRSLNQKSKNVNKFLFTRWKMYVIFSMNKNSFKKTEVNLCQSQKSDVRKSEKK